MGRKTFFGTLPYGTSWRDYAAPVSIESLHEAMRVFFNSFEDSGECRESISVADIQYAIEAVARHFADKQRLALQLLQRIAAFTETWQSRQMENWLILHHRKLVLHPAVVEACARVPLSGPGHFDEGAFFDKIANIAANRPSDVA